MTPEINIEKFCFVPGAKDLFIDTNQLKHTDIVTVVGKTETKRFKYLRYFDIPVPGTVKHFTSVYESEDKEHLLFAFYHSQMHTGKTTDISAEVMTYIKNAFMEKYS